MNIKKLLCLTLVACTILALCSCTEKVQKDTESSEDIPEVTETTAITTTSADKETTGEVPLVSYLEGNWVNENGVREPIDDKTVNGSPYTVKSIDKDANGNITATLLVDNSDVVYTVYRYKVGYAEYSYMEVLFTAKNITFKYSK